VDRVRWIEKEGIRILLEDFSHLEPNEHFLDQLAVAKNIIHSQKENSVLALFDATGSRFNNEVLDEMKSFVNSNTPYIKAAAVVGIQGLLKIALQAITRFSGRSFKVCSSREEALDWLVTLK